MSVYEGGRTGTRMMDGRTPPSNGQRRFPAAPPSRPTQRGSGTSKPLVPDIGALVGNYRILGKLGEGGMGAVYLAEHTIIERKVALKVLLPELSHDPESLGRFFNEAKAAARVQHPGLISVHDFGHLPSGSAYLVMEHLEGETLAARLWREKSLELPLVLEIARQLASALGAAHDQGIIHRDLKPENIFLVPLPDRPEGLRAKVLDFGIAKLVREDSPGSFKTSTGIILGTPTYMSPEQCRGVTPLDHRTDIYSLGCILYEMISGRPPFDGEGPGDVLAAHIHVKPRSLRRLVPSLPLPLERIVLKAMAKRPQARHQRMAELLEDLDIFAQMEQAQHVEIGPAAEVHVVVAPERRSEEITPDRLTSIEHDDTPELVGMPWQEKTRPLQPPTQSRPAWSSRTWPSLGTRTLAMSLGAAVLVGTIAFAVWRSGRSTGTTLPKDAAPPPIWLKAKAAVATPAEPQGSPASTPVPAPPAEGQLPLPRIDFESLSDRRALNGKRRTPAFAPTRRVGDGALNPFEHGATAHKGPKPVPPARGTLTPRRAGVGAKAHR